VGEHRVRDTAGIGRRLGVLFGARLACGLDALAVRVCLCLARTSCCLLRHLLGHTARLGLLFPVALCLIDRLLDWSCLVFLTQVLAHRDETDIFLEFATYVAVGRRNRTDPFLVFNFNRPHLNFTCGRFTVQGWEGRNRRHCLF